MDQNAEHWAPPDSWAVQPADEYSGEEMFTPAISSKNEQADYFPVVEQENWNIPSKNVSFDLVNPH
jgi:adenylate cyclase